MNRDPTKVGRAKVGAELIAEVVNGFVEPISWKTLVRAVILYSHFLRADYDQHEGLHLDIAIIPYSFHQQSIIVIPLKIQPFECTNRPCPAASAVSHSPGWAVFLSYGERTCYLG